MAIGKRGREKPERARKSNEISRLHFYVRFCRNCGATPSTARQENDLAAWVKLIHARACLARDRAALLKSAAAELDGHRGRSAPVGARPHQYAVDPLLTAGLDSTATRSLQSPCCSPAY